MLNHLKDILNQNKPFTHRNAEALQALETEKVIVYIKAVAPHDVNGNPRRCFVIWAIDTKGAHKVAVIDDNYSGDRVYQTYPTAVYLGEIDTTPKEYKYLLKFKASK